MDNNNLKVTRKLTSVLQILILVIGIMAISYAVGSSVGEVSAYSEGEEACTMSDGSWGIFQDGECVDEEIDFDEEEINVETSPITLYPTDNVDSGLTAEQKAWLDAKKEELGDDATEEEYKQAGEDFGKQFGSALTGTGAGLAANYIMPPGIKEGSLWTAFKNSLH